MADRRAGRLSDLLCWSEQSAASIRMECVRQSGAVDEAGTNISGANIFCRVQYFWPMAGAAGGVPVIVGSRRNLNQWQGRPAWVEPWMLMLQRLTNRSADCVIANSLVVAEETFKTERLPHRKLHVAYNGIDLAKFSRLDELREQARQMLGIGQDEIVVGNISCFRKVKGIPQFVDAARLVLEKEPHMRFLAVGDGEQHALVVERIRHYGLEDRFHLAGQQTDVLPYLAAMDIGVLSSLAEGFSNSLLEYMASGLPAVATEVGGNREALEGAGILVPPDDPEALAEAILSCGRQHCGRNLVSRHDSGWNGSAWRGQRSE